MKITDVRISLREEDRLKAYASITLDDALVIRGLRVINGINGYFVSMPSRRRSNGMFQDVVHPINNEARQLIEDTVLDAFEEKFNSVMNPDYIPSASVKPVAEVDDSDD